MARALLTSARHGAYIAIGVYAAMVLVVTLATFRQPAVQPPIQVAYPGVQFEHQVQQTGGVVHSVVTAL